MVVIKRKVRRLRGVFIAGVDVKQWHSNHKDLYHYFTYEYSVYLTAALTTYVLVLYSAVEDRIRELCGKKSATY